MPDLRDARVLSVDVFDTLVLRAVPRPVDTFPLIAALAHERGALQAHVTGAQFASVRACAEAGARRQAHQLRGSHEVSLDEIYQAMPAEWFQRGTQELARAELDITCEVAYANQAVLALVRESDRRGLPVVLTSDTFFSSADLKTLLRRCDIEPEWFAHLVVSSEYGVSKHEGGLFTHLRNLFPQVPVAAIHHLGDHPYSDVEQASRAGLTAILHDNGQAALGPIARLETQRYGAVLPTLHSLRALATRIDAPRETEGRWWFSLGAAHLGPALAAFAEWILDECTRDGISTIRPLMREGGLFATLVARAAAARNLRVDVAPLHASRGATWLAGLDAFDDAAVETLLQRTHLTVREALHVVGLSPADAAVPLDDLADVALADASTTRTRDAHVLSDVLRSTLRAPGLQTRIAAHLAAERAALRAYLDHACGSAETIALVDLGFHGSTGRAIDAAARGISSRRYVQLLAFGADGLRQAWRRGEDIRVFGAGPELHADLAGPIARHPAVLEALLIEGGTTLGYARTGEIGEPHLAPPRAGAAQRAAAAACREGILAFQARWLEWTAARPSEARAVLADRRGLVAPVHRLLTMPTSIEAEQLGEWLHEDNDGGAAVRRLTSPDLVPEDITPQAFMRATASGGRAWDVAWAWPAGTCARRWPGYVEEHWQDVVGADDGSPPAVHLLATRLQREGVTSCHMWGAGEIGLAMLRALRRVQVDVRVIVDSNPALHGTLLDGVRVAAPEAAVRESDVELFVIASFAFASEIERRLRELRGGDSSPLRVVHPAQEALA